MRRPTVRRPRLVAGALLAAGSVGAAVYRRRRRGGAERVDLYYEDGSMVSLADDAPELAQMLPRARAILASARR